MPWKTLLFVGVLTFSATFATAEQPTMAELQKTIQQMNEMMKSQQARIGQLEDKVNKELHAEMAKAAREIAADANRRPVGPTWLENLEFMADIRMRIEQECYSGGGEEGLYDGTWWSRKNTNRARFRVRFGVKKTWLDNQMEGVFRLATGSSNDPRSTNQSFPDNFSKKPIWIDLAYVQYKPKFAPGLTAVVGKMKNPFVRTNVVWDSDVNPEGIWARYERKCGDFTPFVGAGFFSTDQGFRSYHSDDVNDFERGNATMAGYQVGFDWALCETAKWTSAAAYYDYDRFDRSYNIAGGNHVIGTGGTGFDTRLAARDFRVLNVTNILAFRAFDLPWKAHFDWAHNCGDQDTDAEYVNQNNGFAAGLAVGQNKKKGDWAFAYSYIYLEANAVPGNFADSDIQTNSKGHVLSAKYSVTEWMTLGASLWWLERITGYVEDQRNIRTRFECIWTF